MDMITLGNGVVVFIFERGFFPFRSVVSRFRPWLLLSLLFFIEGENIALFAVSVANIVHFTDMQFAFPFRSVCAVAIAVALMVTGSRASSTVMQLSEPIRLLHVKNALEL